MEIEDLRSAAERPKAVNISTMDLHRFEYFISDLIDTCAPVGTFSPIGLTLKVDMTDSSLSTPRSMSPRPFADSYSEYASQFDFSKTNIGRLSMDNSPLLNFGQSMDTTSNASITRRSSSRELSIQLESFSSKIFDSEMKVLKIRQHMLRAEAKKLHREKEAWARQKSKEMSIINRRNSMSPNTKSCKVNLKELVEMENEI